MITADQAIEIANRKKEKEQEIWAYVEGKDDYIFSIDTEEDHNSWETNMSEYVWSLNKNDGNMKPISFDEYCKRIDDGEFTRDDWIVLKK